MYIPSSVKRSPSITSGYGRCSIPHIVSTAVHEVCSLHIAGQSVGDRIFLAAAAGIVIFQCLVLLLLEVVHLCRRHFHYFKEWDNCFQLICFILILTFVAPGFTKLNNCWCAHNWQWQIGALALFLGWINFIVLLKHMPWTAVPVNMFINICKTFLKLLFLPIFLLLAFAFPFYMVFARKASSFEVWKKYQYSGS